jgi:uncharacterized protein (DUF433 family)
MADKTPPDQVRTLMGRPRYSIAEAARYLYPCRDAPHLGPRRLYPFTRDQAGQSFGEVSREERLDNPRIIAIDPGIRFGKPVVISRGISTSVIADRFGLGEGIEEIARDYQLDRGEVEEAVRYERRSERRAA